MFVRKCFDQFMRVWLTLFIKKQFSCEITGHMNLSFFEALISEVSTSPGNSKGRVRGILPKAQTNSSQDVDQTFPEALKDPVLRKVQFSTVSRIDTLGKMEVRLIDVQFTNII